MLDAFSNLGFKFDRAYDVYIGSYVAEEFSRFLVRVFWGDEQNGDVMGSTCDEHIIQQKLKHRRPALLGRYNLVKITDHNVYLPFSEMVDRLSVSVPSIRDRQCLNAFRRQSR
jgi:hypothetical protein